MEVGCKRIGIMERYCELQIWFIKEPRRKEEMERGILVVG